MGIADDDVAGGRIEPDGDRLPGGGKADRDRMIPQADLALASDLASDGGLAQTASTPGACGTRPGPGSDDAHGSRVVARHSRPG